MEAKHFFSGALTKPLLFPHNPCLFMAFGVQTRVTMNALRTWDFGDKKTKFNHPKRILKNPIKKTSQTLPTVPQIPKPPTLVSFPEEEAVSNEDKDLSMALQCQHFARCSGCTREWDIDKPNDFEEAKLFFDDRGIHDLTLTSGKLWEWRCRVKLSVRGTTDEPLIGLYQGGSHYVLEVPSCQVHHPSINSVVPLLKEGMKKCNINPYDEASGNGDLRYVQMAVTTYDTSVISKRRYGNGKVQLSLVWNSRNESYADKEKLESLSQFLWSNAGAKSEKRIIHSVWANFNISRSNAIFGDQWLLLRGEQDFWEHIGGVDICFNPSSFAQANTQVFNMLLYKLGRYVKQGSTVVELYAGVGVIGLSLAVTKKCRSIKCVEINKESKLSFERSVSRLPKSLECSISWHCADASESPIHWLEGSDVVVVDPPRKGLDASVIDALLTASSSYDNGGVTVRNRVEKRPWILRAQKAAVNVGSKIPPKESGLWPETLIYVSCGWESFKKDCVALMSKKAWHLEKAHAFHFFPGTDRIEVLAIFKRGERKKAKKKSAPKASKRKTYS